MSFHVVMVTAKCRLSHSNQPGDVGSVAGGLGGGELGPCLLPPGGPQVKQASSLGGIPRQVATRKPKRAEGDAASLRGARGSRSMKRCFSWPGRWEAHARVFTRGSVVSAEAGGSMPRRD